SSESESDDDIEDYIPPIPYGAFKDWEIVRCPLRNTYYHVYYQENRRQKSFFYLKQLLPHVYREDLLLLRRRMNRYFRLNPDVDVGLDLWRDVNLLCQSLHSDDVEDFWRTQDEWVVSSWKLYPKSSVHVLDLTNGKTVYMFVDKVYPIRATLLERMLRHRLTVPPSYCRDVVVAGNVIQTVQAGLRESYECLASVPIACTARQMVFSSPWLTAKKESGSPLQTALVCNSNPLMVARLPKPGCPEQTATGKDMSNPLYGCDSFAKKLLGYSNSTLDSCSAKLDWFVVTTMLLFFDVAASFDSAVHRVHAVSIDAVVASTVFCISFVGCMMLLLTLYHRYDRILRGKDHCRCLLQTSIPAQKGCSAHIHQPHRILRSNRKLGCVASEMEETKGAETELGELIELLAVDPRYVVMKYLNQKPFLYPMVSGILSSHYVAFPVREKWKNLNLDVSLVAPSACIYHVSQQFSGSFGWDGDWILETGGCGAALLSLQNSLSLLIGGGLAFSMMKNGIVNGNYEQIHKEEIDYKKANMRKLNLTWKDSNK
ncbi:hypothetical protein Tco_0413698, partial [Tanacetum coccineum]